MSISAWTKKETEAWNSLKKRFPGISSTVDHFGARMAAGAESKTNILIDIVKKEGGYHAELTAYHRLCTHGQRFSLNDPDMHSHPGEYPDFFESIDDAVSAAMKEREILHKAVTKAVGQ